VAQDSILHRAVHAQLERRRGELDDARKVDQTVVLSSKPPATVVGLQILWYNWARKPGVIKIILRLVDIEITNSGVAFSGKKENWKMQPTD